MVENQIIPEKIEHFLHIKTPNQWLSVASQHLDLILNDHAHCEKKAASSALGLIFRYPDKPVLLQKMSRLAREELRHFEQVLKIMQQRGIAYTHLTPARYAKALQQHVRTFEPGRLVDSLIVAAFIEARSCERFAALAVYLDAELAQFYQGLLAAESRHFQDYLALALYYANEDISQRINFFAEIEAALIVAKEEILRFHSGIVCEPELGYFK